MKNLLITVGICFLCLTGYAQEKRIALTEPKMGSPFTIMIWHADTSMARAIIYGAFQVADSLIRVFSDYDVLSETSKFNLAQAGEWIHCSPAMMQLVSVSKAAMALSHGSFDISIGALTAKWRVWRRGNIFPNPDSVILQKAYTGIHLLRIDSTNARIMKLDSQLALDFGAIAKGFIAEQVKDFCVQQNASRVLVDAGGDIVCGEAPPGKNGWSIGVNMPESDEVYQGTILLKHKAVATSGDLYQGMMHNNVWYSHIIDPRTGYGSTQRRNVTVIASDGASADWLATSFSILPFKKIKKLAKMMKAEWMIATHKRAKIIIRRSRNFPDLQK